ncbi:putative integral membrane protein [Babesia bovis T2Bo]|uniref:putative integral membrane protein n=1 Tax=Babesia bovis T2Bo TaxID=484906 RepID=UPI001D6F4BD6|nr:putative integral membrane protein [Babesia bovis T2Bo]KAG6439904.1 putative integral membrane protein [Babesia bovis T2Bo]
MTWSRVYLYAHTAIMLSTYKLMSLKTCNGASTRPVFDTNRNVLQPSTQDERSEMDNNRKHCNTGHCSKPRRSDHEERFLNYIIDSAKSPTGMLLDEIIQVQLAQPLMEPEQPKIATQQEPVSAFSEVQLMVRQSYKTHIQQVASHSWDFINITVLLFSGIAFLYVVATDPLSNSSMSIISAHVIASLFLGLTHDVMPLWLLMTLSFTGEAILSLALQFMDGKSQQRIFIFFAAMVKAKLIYDLLALVPIDFLSPEYTGFAGMVAHYVFFTSNFMALRVLYAVTLFIIAMNIYRQLPKYMAIEPSELEDQNRARTIKTKMVCFVASWPLAALIPQILCICWSRRNPLGPFTFFFVPTTFRLLNIETWAALITWGAVAAAMFKYCNEKYN